MASLIFPSIAKKATLRDGTTYGYVRVAAREGKPTVLFLHGYPSSSYDWRYQIDHFSKRGYGLLVPDLLGYGDTDKPEALEAYTMRNMGRQVVELLDHEKLETVVGVAHDWGCGLQASIARWHQDRFSAFVFMSVGYLADSVGGIDQINEMTEKQLGYPLFGYWVFHGQEDAGAAIDKNPDAYTSIFYPHEPELWKTVMCPIGEIRKWTEQGKTKPLPKWLSEEEVATHRKVLAIGGYAQPLKWYKQAMAGLSSAEEEGLPEPKRHVHLPVLFVRTEKDYVCIPNMQEQGTKPYVKDLKIASLDTTHWGMLEQPEKANQILEDFIIGLKA